MRALLLVSCLGFACAAPSSEPAATSSEAEAPPASAGTVERLDPSFADLVAEDAVIEKLADGFQFTEGPVWVSSEGEEYLLFSDIPANTIYKWSEGEGKSVFLQPVMPPDAETGGRGGSNGLTLDPEGRVVLCEHGNRQLSRLEADGTRTVLADRYDGKRLNSPNDAVWHSDGSAYFTDPPYGLADQDDDENKELPWNGIYRLMPDGEVRLLNNEQTRPNGIGLSPDERTLYVANSDQAPRKLWMAYPVADDGSLGEGRVFHDASASTEAGAPDGLTVDRHGNVWATGPGGVWVLSPEGKHLGTIKPDEVPANAGWGDDGRTLYMTARTGLYRIRTQAGQ